MGDGSSIVYTSFGWAGEAPKIQAKVVVCYFVYISVGSLVLVSFFVCFVVFKQCKILTLAYRS